MKTKEDFLAQVRDLRERGECLAKAGVMKQAAQGPQLVAECLETMVEIMARCEAILTLAEYRCAEMKLEASA